ncbi:hypothetical protein D3C77_593620 [compost metagenome]
MSILLRCFEQICVGLRYLQILVTLHNQDRLGGAGNELCRVASQLTDKQALHLSAHDWLQRRYYVLVFHWLAGFQTAQY